MRRLYWICLVAVLVVCRDASAGLRFGGETLREKNVEMNTVSTVGNSQATITVQQNDTTVDANTNTVDFSTAFTATSSPAGEANVGLGGGIACSGGTCALSYWDSATTISNTGTPGSGVNDPGILVTISAPPNENLNRMFLGSQNPALCGGDNDTSLFRAFTSLSSANGLLNAGRCETTIGADHLAVLGVDKWEPTGVIDSTLQDLIGVAGVSYMGNGNLNTNTSRGLVYGVIGEAGNISNNSVNTVTGVYGAVVFSGTGTTVNSYAGYFTNPGTANNTNAFGVYISAPAAGTNQIPLAISDGGFRTDVLTSATADRTLTLPDATGTFALTSGTSDLTITKADPSLIYDVTTATDTDFWAGVQDDAGGDDDDTYQIGTGTTTGSNTQLTLTNAGALTIGTINTGLGAVELAAGQWTPTTNNIANLDSSSAAEGQYLRVGATVTGSVQLTVDPTAATTSTQLELDLPVTSNFGATSDASGSCGSADIEDEVAGIRADATSNELEVLWVTNSAASHEVNCTFSYQVI